MRALFVMAGVLAITPAVGAAQTLGEIAAKEKARREAITAPARVITSDDLRAVPPPAGEPAPTTLLDSGSADPAAPPRTLVSAARLQGGGTPQIPVMAVAGGEVVLEVGVDRDGAVTGITTVRHTPPFTETLQSAVRGWRFRPAEDVATPPAGEPVDPATRAPTASTVLVIGLFRPPGLFNVTLGEPPKTTAQPSPSAPGLQSVLTLPPYPPQALADGVVLIELQLSAQGAVERTSIVRSAAPFDQPALDAVKGLGFRPPRVGARTVPSTVYAVVAFRQPITP